MCQPLLDGMPPRRPRLPPSGRGRSAGYCDFVQRPAPTITGRICWAPSAPWSTAPQFAHSLRQPATRDGLFPALKRGGCKRLHRAWAFLLGHDLFGKLLHTFPDHALPGTNLSTKCEAGSATITGREATQMSSKESAVYQPEELHLLGDVLDQVVRSLPPNLRTPHNRLAIARNILACAQTGERDPAVLRRSALGDSTGVAA